MSNIDIMYSEEIKSENPRLASKAAVSPLACLRLFCLACASGDRDEVKGCEFSECFLFKYRCSNTSKE